MSQYQDVYSIRIMWLTSNGLLRRLIVITLKSWNGCYCWINLTRGILQISILTWQYLGLWKIWQYLGLMIAMATHVHGLLIRHLLGHFCYCKRKMNNLWKRGFDNKVKLFEMQLWLGFSCVDFLVNTWKDVEKVNV